MAKRTRRRAKFSDQIRHAIDNCGMTRYQIAKEMGISESTLSRFVSGERGLPTRVLDVLAERFGWTLTTKQGRETGERR